MGRMIKRSLFILLIIFVFSGLAFGDEVTEVWSRLYEKAISYQQKYDIMLNIVELQNRDIIPTLVKALGELTEIVNVNKKDAEIVKKLKILTIRKLGDLKAAQASDLIFDVVRNTKDPFVKSEALIALGKIGAKKYTEHIAVMLKNLTLYRGAEDIQGQDAIAYGCIYALERFRDPRGYLPVFLAANGGYSRYVKDAAKKALVNMVDDPSDILEGIVKYESSIKLKIAALKAEDNSKAPAENKIRVATGALDVGLTLEPQNVTEATYLRDLRIYAMRMILKYKIKDDNAVPLLERVLYESRDLSEKIYAIRSLSSINTDKSVMALVRYLSYHNDRMESGISPKDNRLLIELIRGLGATGNPKAYEELLRAKYDNYPSVIVREAEKALKKIKK